MNTWREAALAYKDDGLRLKDIVEKIEAEFGLENMYARVRQYLHRQRVKAKKNELPEKKSVHSEPGTEILRR